MTELTKRPKKKNTKNDHVCSECSSYAPVWQGLCENNPNNKPMTKGNLERELLIINGKLETIIDLLRRTKP